MQKNSKNAQTQSTKSREMRNKGREDKMSNVTKRNNMETGK